MTERKSVQADSVLFAVQELENMEHEIANRLADVVAEINRVNAEREELTNRKHVVRRGIESLNDDPALDCQLFRQVLQTRYNDLLDRIDELRPDDLLRQKVQLTRRLEEIRSAAVLGTKVVEKINGQSE